MFTASGFVRRSVYSKLRKGPKDLDCHHRISFHQFPPNLHVKQFLYAVYDLKKERKNPVTFWEI